MKQFITKIKSEIVEFKNTNKYLNIFSDINTLSENGLSPLEIELFLNLDLKSFDDTFFTTYFKSYRDLRTHLNIIELCVYISFVENFKKDLINHSLKKLMYPLFLIAMTFTTLLIFDQSLMVVLNDYVSESMRILLKVVFLTSFLSIISLVIFSIIFIFVFRNPVGSILGYNRLINFTFFKTIEYFYLSVFSHLLISFYKAGYSTHDSLKLIQRFKDNRVISNIAYFMNSDLEDGLGIEESIQKMLVNDTFKNVLIFSLKSRNFISLFEQYYAQLNLNINREIDRITRFLYTLSYLYIGVVVLLLYKIISLPLNILSDF